MVELSDVALKVLESRYFLKKKEDGARREDWEGLCERVAAAIASAELQYGSEADVERWGKTFYHMIHDLYFLPNSPTLMNAGVPGGQLSACFVLGVDDDIPSIFGTVKDMAMIFKSGGGVGLPMGRLRSKGSPVKSTGGFSSGPVSFMRVFNTTAEVVAQGGKRRGALMGTLPVDHPDIMEFIKVKQDLKELASFNLSVTVTDEFMTAAVRKLTYELKDPHTGSTTYVNAGAVWDAIVECAWRTGEPGLIFIDRMNRFHQENVAQGEEHLIEGTNPCSEAVIRAYESCNLGSINLARMVKDDWSDVNRGRLIATTRAAVRFLDNVIDVNTYPLEKIKERTLDTRKIGLGVMGWADMLAKLGLVYGTEGANTLLAEVLQIMKDNAIKESQELAEHRGHYPAQTTLSTRKPRRNGSLMAIAPTGSISMIAGCNGGIEPFFSVAAQRKSTLDGEPFVQVNQTFVEVMRLNGYSDDHIDAVAKRVADGDDLDQYLPDTVKGLFVCAHQIAPDQHVDTLAAAQARVDQGASKTINLPNGARLDAVARAFLRAYEQGCKSISVYRDGCRDAQPMSVGKARIVEKEPDGSVTGVGSMSGEELDRCMEKMRESGKIPAGLHGSSELKSLVANPLVPTHDDEIDIVKTVKQVIERILGGDDKVLRGELARAVREAGLPIAPPGDAMTRSGNLKPKDRPGILPGSTVKMKTGCGTLFVTVSTDEGGNPIELFAHHGKAGVCSQAQCEAIGRLCSAALRAGVDAKELAMQLRGITCHEQAGFGPNRVSSCADGVGKAILAALDDGQSEEPDPDMKPVPVYYGACPQCGSGTIREAGCIVCKSCGWDKCS